MVSSRTLLFALLSLVAASEAAGQCSGSINIVNPSEGATVSSHFQIDATAASSCSVTTLHLYLDNRLQFAQYGQAALSGKFHASMGTHKVVVQAWAADGRVFSKTIHVTVNRQVASACIPVFDPNVRVCAPANLNEAEGVIVLQAAAASTASPLLSLRAFVGGKLKAASYNENARQIDAALSLARGLQNINVVARTANGAEFHNETNVQIVSASSSCQAPFISSLRPAGGDEPEFPPFLVAADAAACPITSLQVYVDNRLFYEQQNQKIFEGRLTLEPGTHNVVLQARNSQGAVSKKALTINVFGLEEPTCLPDTDPGVTICQAEPTDNGYVITFVGTPATPASTFTALRIYVDNVARATFRNFAAQRGITFLKMSAGAHKIVAVAWTGSGAVVTARQMVTVP